MNGVTVSGDAVSHVDLLSPTQASRRLHRVLDANRERILTAWIEAVPTHDRDQYPDLRRQLASLLSGLSAVFATGDWQPLQRVIEDLAACHGASGLRLEKGLQRTLLDMRHSARPYLEGSDPECDEVLLSTLHECLLRFFEAHQGVTVASETDRLHTRLIHSLVTALEARDPYTKGHSVSVALLAQKIAAALDDAPDPEKAYLAGLLHDVGKVGIPDGILSKPGPLTEDEWAIMREHPSLGAKIIGPIKLYPEIIEAVLAHHENLDGSGYPLGLSGSAIPPIARIIRVVDSFDAMTSARVFRQSLTFGEAATELGKQSGEIYDEEVVLHLDRIVGSESTMRELGLATLQLDLIS